MATVTSGPATIVKAIFTGNASAGPISMSGVNSGDVLVRCMPDGFVSGFEPVVSVTGQLQQTNSYDWSSVAFTAYFLRGD